MDFEAIRLYNKIILGPATPKEIQNVMNKHVLQKQKKCAWKIKSGANKKGTVRASTRGLKKENKRIRSDRTRLLQKYVPYTKGTSHFGIVWNRNRWSVFEHSAIAVNTQKHLAATRVDIQRRDQRVNSPPL